MKQKMILETLNQRRSAGLKSFALLIDPDKIKDQGNLVKLINIAVENRVNFFFVGGSLLTGNNMHQVIQLIKSNSQLPVVLFPGSNMHIDVSADAVLFLSLISGRNPDLLIGQQVIAAPILKRSNLEILPTGYLLIDADNYTTVSYMSNTVPIPADKYSIAVCTAMAGEMLGLKLIYMDAGSGAKYPINPRMIASVRKSIDVPLIIGGGINSVEKALTSLKAGADMLVVGNGIEENPNLLIEVSDAINNLNQELDIH
jgi:putative glycerol-1-phosphate prenyltransferase